MATSTISGFSTLSSTWRANSLFSSSSSSSSSSFSIPLRAVHLQLHGSNPNFTVVTSNKKQQFQRRRRIVRSVAEETQVSEVAEDASTTTTTTEQPVSVPVSPSDFLTMFFQAEGTMSESVIPKVTKVLEETEGITNLKVQVLEGIASVELTKQTTVQATGVASSLVEIIQGLGFKLQTLNLSFDDEEDVI